MFLENCCMQQMPSLMPIFKEKVKRSCRKRWRLMWIISISPLYLLRLTDCRNTSKHKWKMPSARK